MTVPALALGHNVSWHYLALIRWRAHGTNWHRPKNKAAPLLVRYSLLRRRQYLQVNNSLLANCDLLKGRIVAIVPSGTKTRLWSAIVIVALLGVISWGVNAFYPSDPLLLGMGIWAGAIAACAILLKAISSANDFLKALAAMWRPVVFICAAGKCAP